MIYPLENLLLPDDTIDESGDLAKLVRKTKMFHSKLIYLTLQCSRCLINEKLFIEILQQQFSFDWRYEKHY
jgi:hypothetical protein